MADWKGKLVFLGGKSPSGQPTYSWARYEKAAFQKKGGAVSLKFGKGDSTLGIEMTDDFHRSEVR